MLTTFAILAVAFPTSSLGDDAPERPVFDVPHLSGITIDGDPSDWTGRGLAVDVLNTHGPRRMPLDRFDAQLHAGWDDRGLLLLVDVTDPNVHESESPVEFGGKASVEAILDANGGKEHWQTSISPGVDPLHPVMRIRLHDDRSKENRTVPLSVQAAATKTARGYILELLLPWNTLGVEPKVGSNVGLQVWVNKPDGREGQRLGWFPRQLRLAETPGAPVTAVVDGDYDRLCRTRFVIAATAQSVGKIAQIKAGDAVLAEATLHADGRLATAEISVPMPSAGTTYGPVAALLDGKFVDVVKLPDVEKARREAISGLDFCALPSVFTTRDLPAADFYSPQAADVLLGDYTLHTTYYDTDYNVVTSADHPGRYGAVVEVTPKTGKPFKQYLTLYRQPAEMKWWPARVETTLRLPPQLGIDPAVSIEQATEAGNFVGTEMGESRWHDGVVALYAAGLSEIPPGAGNLPVRLAPEGRDINWWYGLQKKIGDLQPYHYGVHVPDRTAGDEQKKLPLMLFLHGSGERGDKLDDVAVNGPPMLLKNDPDWAFGKQCIVVWPQCPAGSAWNPLLLRDLLDEVMARYPVDPDRVYLTGLSMGGFGTWQLAQWFPERFAAIVPISAGGDPTDMDRLKDIPTWVIHGAYDRSVNINNAYEMVQALREVHGRVRFTIYPDRGHNAWEPAYEDPKLYEWLLQQRRGEPKQPRTTAAGTQPADQ